MSKTKFSFFLVTLLLVFLIFNIENVYAETLNIPSSEKSVVLDANLEQDEWDDAIHIQFDSLNGGLVDVYMKYDKIKQLFLCGFIIDDSTPDPEDIFFLGVDRDASGDEKIQDDDYLLSIFRDSLVLSANFHIDTTLGEGTGNGWEYYDDFDANIQRFKSPFRDLVWVRGETSRSGPIQGDSWSGEFSLYLPLTAQTASGSVNDGLTMGFLIGFEDTQPVKNYRFSFYSIGEIEGTEDTLTPVSPSVWTTVYLYKEQILPEPANIVYKSLSVDPENLEIGEEVTITLTLENTGDLEGDEQVMLYINDELAATWLVNVGGKETEIETLTYSPDAGGSYTVKSSTLEESFSVNEPEPEPEPELAPANIIYKSISLSPNTLTVGEEATITVVLENTGDETGTEDIEIFLGEEKIATQTVTIDGKNTKTITITHMMDSAGTFIAKSSTLTTSITVAEEQTEPETSTGIPSFPIISIILAIVFSLRYTYVNRHKSLF